MTHAQVTPMAMWMRTCVLMALGQLHSLPDPLVQNKQHLQNLVPRHSWLAKLPQHHSPSPSRGLQPHIIRQGWERGGQSQAG